MLPSFYLPLLNWDSGLDYKTLALKLRHMVGFVAIAVSQFSSCFCFVNPWTLQERRFADLYVK